MPRSRDLSWDGCLNVRDLGGHPTEDGEETRWGAIVRSDSVRELTDEGWQTVVRHGVRTIVDLRTARELEADPPADLPVEVLHVPFIEDDEAVFEEADKAGMAAPDPASGTRDVYLIFLERFKENVAAAVRAVAKASDGAVVIHCMGGKDRTGLVTAFLLRLAGVPVAEIAIDYALSEDRLRPRHEAWFAGAADDTELARLRRMAATPAATMVGVFEELDRRYGGVEGYLRAAGLTDEELALARQLLRD
ncbi:MAG: tyrosine-protein phosphatase [Actinobacteria bacterium]|nr:tyrosine-protein phosphatase [Actinomycetota bacterium]